MSHSIFKSLLLILLCIAPSLVAQAQIVNKKVNKSTYVFNYDKGVVYNKQKALIQHQYSMGEDFDIDNDSIIPNSFKNVLGTKRIQELKNNRIILSFACDQRGKIENINFIFPGMNCFLTSEEIASLEKTLLSKQFPVKIYNKNAKSITFTRIYSFNQML